MRAEIYSDHILSKLPDSIWLDVHTRECKILTGFIYRALYTPSWRQHVHLPTRNHNTLDLIFCHNVTPTSVVVGEEFHDNDYKMVLSILPIFANCNKLETVDKCSQYRDYAYTGWENLWFLIKHYDSNSFPPSDQLLETLEIFDATIKSALDTIIPSKIAFKTITPYINQKTRSELYYISKDFRQRNVLLPLPHLKFKKYHIIKKRRKKELRWQHPLPTAW